MCSNCGEEKKSLTVHGTCWKCHVKSIRPNKPCKNCRSTEQIHAEHRTKHEVTTSSRVISVIE